MALAASLLVPVQPDALCGQQRQVRVTGTVTEARSGRPVRAVAVLHGLATVGLTDDAGRFEAIVQVDGTEVALTFRRIGYGTLTRTFQVPRPANQTDIEVALDQLPTVLEEIVVEGERVVIRNPGLVGFYNRREEGIGRYLTQAQIDRAKSFDLTPYFRRLFRGFPGSCIIPPTVYLDGIKVDSLAKVNRIIPPVLVGGIEVYTGEQAMRLPPEFVPTGACQVILVWTREPKGPSEITIAWQLGGQLTGTNSMTRLTGGRVQFPLRSPPSTLQVQFGMDANLGNDGERWYLFVIPTLRPLGVSSPWYVGTGVVAADDNDIVFKHAVTSGLYIGARRLKPFVEFRLLEPMRLRQATLFVFTGLAVQLGPRSP